MISHFNPTGKSPITREEEWGTKLVWTLWKRDTSLSPIQNQTNSSLV
jgi:hypothetical protein